jgi:uncharacterized protein YndB with AHSA1/START domain/DNA-binding transcriptional ArsR family regulator
MHVERSMPTDVFKALADPSRRQLLDRLNARNGQSLRELGEGLGMARQSVRKHVAVLEAANLVTPVRRGRERLHFLNPAPLNEIAERWIDRYDRGRTDALADLETAPEEPAVPKPAAVYTIHIHATPERVWRALTDPALTERYWETTLRSDWRAGSAVVWEHHGDTIADPEQVVLECDPPRRLSYTWHTFTPEWAYTHGIGGDLLARVAAEPRSKVAFELEPAGDTVKLTVIHDGFEPGSTVLRMVSDGWPLLLSDLKTLLEADARVAVGA